jgi:trypsin
VSLSLSGSLECGGVLLNAHTVLTAAHCSSVTPSSAKVRAGSIVSHYHLGRELQRLQS